MKIALAPDLHCFYNTNDKLNKLGKSRREEEWKNSTEYMLNQCVANEVTTIVFPGDYFVNPKPTAKQILLISNLFRKFEENKIRVIGTTGNHDISGANTKSMGDVVSAIGGNKNWCVTTFDTLRIYSIGFAFLPFVKTPEIMAYNPAFATMEASEQLIQIAGNMFKKLGEDPKVKKKILIGHWAIAGSKTSSGKTMERTLNGTEVTLPLGDLTSQGWDACLFGHIHKPQVLSKSKPFVAYSGCVQRINIGEANDERGFFIYDTDTDTYNFINIPAIQMKTFYTKINTKEDVDSFYKEIEATELKDKIVQVIYEISKNNIDFINKKEILKLLEEKEVMSIGKVSPKILEESRQRDISLTESLDGQQALEKWLIQRNEKEETKEKVIKLFRQYKSFLSE